MSILLHILKRSITRWKRRLSRLIPRIENPPYFTLRGIFDWGTGYFRSASHTFVRRNTISSNSEANLVLCSLLTFDSWSRISSCIYQKCSFLSEFHYRHIYFAFRTFFYIPITFLITIASIYRRFKQNKYI